MWRHIMTSHDVTLWRHMTSHNEFWGKRMWRHSMTSYNEFVCVSQSIRSGVQSFGKIRYLYRLAMFTTAGVLANPLPSPGLYIGFLSLCYMWDLTLFGIWIWDLTSFEIGIWDLTPFEIGIWGFQDPPLHTPIYVRIRLSKSGLATSDCTKFKATLEFIYFSLLHIVHIIPTFNKEMISLRFTPSKKGILESMVCLTYYFSFHGLQYAGHSHCLSIKRWKMSTYTWRPWKT